MNQTELIQPNLRWTKPSRFCPTWYEPRRAGSTQPKTNQKHFVFAETDKIEDAESQVDYLNSRP